jgi:hypothetical protein
LRFETSVEPEYGPVSVDPPGPDVRLVHVLVLALLSVEVSSMLLGGSTSCDGSEEADAAQRACLRMSAHG